MKDCLFCKIIKGDHPSEKVYEDEHTYAFLDIHPVNSGHTLVVPKIHTENIHEISPENFTLLMETVRKLSIVIKTATKTDGINIEINNGSIAGQVIFHLHVHIIPRLADDGHKHWPRKDYQEGESTLIAERIRREADSLKDN